MSENEQPDASPSTKPDEDWCPCPMGQLVGFAKDIRYRRQRRQLLQVGAGMAGVAAMGLGVWLGTRPGQVSPEIAGIHCHRVVDLGPQYAANTLSPEKRAQIDRHLKRCAPCKDHYLEKNHMT